MTDYTVGTASYCGVCTHAASHHNKHGGFCTGRPNFHDECDCTRSPIEVGDGARASGIVHDAIAIGKKRAAAQWKGDTPTSHPVKRTHR